MEKKISGPSKENMQDWELINPAGVKLSEAVKLNPHPATLEGKTVMLTWNHKPNGEIFQNRLATLLAREVKNVKIIKLWELEPSTAIVSHNPGPSKQIAEAALKYKPDIAINAQGD